MVINTCKLYQYVSSSIIYQTVQTISVGLVVNSNVNPIKTPDKGMIRLVKSKPLPKFCSFEEPI